MNDHCVSSSTVVPHPASVANHDHQGHSHILRPIWPWVALFAQCTSTEKCQPLHLQYCAMFTVAVSCTRSSSHMTGGGQRTLQNVPPSPMTTDRLLQRSTITRWFHSTRVMTIEWGVLCHVPC